MMSRTSVRRAGLAALILAAALFPACADKPGVYKNVILFIGDGMSVESEIAASRYLHGVDYGLAWQTWPGHSYVATWDVTDYNRNAKQAGRPPYAAAAFTPSLGYDPLLDGLPFEPPLRPGEVDAAPVRRPATDSASAATALATGRKTESGEIAWAPGRRPNGRLATIAEDYRALRGAGIGVVSTVPFDHATPASFISHNGGRSAYYTGYKGYKGVGLADEIILETKPDVVIGGGHPMIDNPSFDPKKGYISAKLLDALRGSPDWVFVERSPQADGGEVLADAARRAAASGKRLFGLFGGEGGMFTPLLPDDDFGHPRLSRENREDPTLAQAALAALEVLGRSPKGFFLVVEQGDIDWGNHDNNFRSMVGSMCDLDEAVKAAEAFVDRPGDAIDWTNTVLLVTADHATGGLTLNPGRPLGMGRLPRQLPRGSELEPDAPGAVNGSTAAKPGPKAAKTFKSPFTYPDGEVGYDTIGHGNAPVTLAVKGPAARFFLKYKGWWYPGPLLDNTQINAALRDALGLPPLPIDRRPPASERTSPGKSAGSDDD